MDIAPTILDLLKLPPLTNIDGYSWRGAMLQENNNHTRKRKLFFETGDSLSEIETDHIDINSVVKKELSVFQIDPTNGYLIMSPQALSALIKNKQFSVLTDEWLLVRYPASMQIQLKPTGYSVAPPYYVLVNIKTGQWAVGLTSAWAKRAPIGELLNGLKQFYSGSVVK